MEIIRITSGAAMRKLGAPLKRSASGDGCSIEDLFRDLQSVDPQSNNGPEVEFNRRSTHHHRSGSFVVLCSMHLFPGKDRSDAICRSPVAKKVRQTSRVRTHCDFAMDSTLGRTEGWSRNFCVRMRCWAQGWRGVTT